MSNGAQKRRIVQRVYKDLQDPEGAPKRARERGRQRTRRVEEKKRREQERREERLREYRSPRPMIERFPDAFPREQVEEYQRAKEARDRERLIETNLRKDWKKKGYSEEDIDAKYEEYKAGRGPFRERFHRKADEGGDE